MTLTAHPVGTSSSTPARPVHLLWAGRPGTGGSRPATDSQWVALAILATVVALALRGTALTAKSLWFDETFSVFLASQPVTRLLALVAANDPHPPLYYLLLHFWIVVFGNGEVAVRALSVLISTASVLVTWLFGRRLVGPLPALLAAGFVAVAPSQVATGQQARMYGLLTLIGIASWWVLQTAVSGGRRRAWIIYALGLAAMIYTHYYGFFIWASQGAYLAWRRTTGSVDWRRWVYASLAVLLLFLPWLPAFIDQLASGRAWPAHRSPLSWTLPVDTLWGMTMTGSIVNAVHRGAWTVQAVSTAGVPLVGIAAAGLLGLIAIRSRKYPRDAKGLLLFAALFPLLLSLLVSLGINVFSPRYLVFIMPAIALVMGAGISAVWASPRRWATSAAVALAIAVLVPNAIGLVSFYRKPRLDVFDWRRIAQALAAEARPDDAIVFLPGFSRIPVNYYFRGPQPRLALTPDGADVVGAGGARMDAVVPFLARHPRVWIVTVPPVPTSVNAMIDALRHNSYRLTKQGNINMAHLILLERLSGR